MLKSLAHPDFVHLDDLNTSILSVPRYATKYNFTGKPMRGYNRNSIVICKAMIEPLKAAHNKLLQLGYQLVVYDSYRPSKAVEFYMQFINDNDFATKDLYFPFINNKYDLVDIQYVATKCPHSRGAAVDVSILKLGQELITPDFMVLKTVTLNNKKVIKYLDDGTEFMGTHFDFFDQSSHWGSALISEQAQKNRNILLKVMQQSGFQSYQKEWWHFQLANEPYPNIYFDFDIQ